MWVGRSFLSFGIGACAAALLLGCGPVRSVTVGRDAPHRHPEPEVHGHAGHPHGHGPPAHAPAHGYRKKHKHAYHHRHDATVEVVFDGDLGVYVVVGLPSHYYWDGRYVRIDGGRWWESRHLDAGWRVLADASVPGPLRAKHAHGQPKAKGKAKHKAKGPQHPAKRR